MESDLEAFGIDPNTLPPDAQDENDFFPILEENAETVALFIQLATQWKVTGFGGVLGLDYVAVEATMNMVGTENRKQMLEDLQIMEMAALRVLNKGAQK